MSLYIVGSGRCGTKSISAAFGGSHEPACDVILPLATQYLCGLPSVYVQTLLEHASIEEVQSHYRYGELIPELAKYDPDAKFLWVKRGPSATQESMVRNGWYDPRDDGLWPTALAGWSVDRNLQASIQFYMPHNAYRITAPLVGEMPWRQWAQEPQWWRCAWWVRFIDGLIYRNLVGRPHRVVDIDRVRIDDLLEIGEWAGVEVESPGVPHIA